MLRFRHGYQSVRDKDSSSLFLLDICIRMESNWHSPTHAALVVMMQVLLDSEGIDAYDQASAVVVLAATVRRGSPKGLQSCCF